jgi:transposase
MSMRLDECPGVGPALATALVATVADPKVFRSGRNFSAWIGLVPKQHSSGGKDRLGSISKQGDRYLRSLFVAGALAVIRYAKSSTAEGWRHQFATCWSRSDEAILSIGLLGVAHTQSRQPRRRAAGRRGQKELHAEM